MTQHTSPAIQIDAVLCEDAETAMFYAHLKDDGALCVNLDLPAAAAQTFDPCDYVRELLALGRSHAMHRLRQDFLTH